MLEFGRILRYSDRGFGFISRELYKNAGEAYFHITTIKRKYSQLTQAIDKGKWRNVSLFYVTQHGQKGDAVSDVWLDVSDLPEELKAELKNFLRLYWHNLSDELSVHVERFCHKLYNTEELNNLKNQRERRVQIKEFCNERKISKLVHFTQICNLENILTNG
ncbi:MAG: hypothetical protein NZL92_12290, partial [Gloeomargarita sp. SKYG116]|nr:hypothetical protein [Gloeomargarita sp. SKYG116]MDW8402459.1 hypothetical protein [Gloeomargarita sp. SKYGB_i_bin116]